MTEPHDVDPPTVTDDSADETAAETAADVTAASVTRAEREAAAQTYRGTHLVVAPLTQPAPPSTVPVADGSGSVADRLAIANATARADSLARVEKWFPGYDFQAAAQTTDDRRFTVLNLGSELFDHLDAVATVERIVAEQSRVGRGVTFSNGDPTAGEPHRVIDPAAPQMRRLRVGPLVGAISEQWTTILNNIDDTEPVIAGVLEHLERVYGSRVNTNVYISWGAAKGFGAHWDEHDTIIVPALGSKHWRVFEPTTLSPRRPWVGAEVSQRPVWEGNIEPGMCLVIPRGWGHEVGGSDDLAIHYTIGVNRLTVQHLFERITVESGYSPLARADVAYDPSAPTSSYDVSIHDEPDVFSTLVSDLATPELVGRAISTFRARMPLRMFPRLFDAWTAAGTGEWAGMTLRMPVAAGVQLIDVQPDAAALAFADRRIEVTTAALDVLIALADARPHAIEALPVVDGDEERRAEICKELVIAGLIDVRDEG